MTSTPPAEASEPLRPSRRSRLARFGAALLGIGLAAAAVAALMVWWLEGGLPGSLRETCRAGQGEETVALAPEQARHAATISAVAVQRALPARAVTIALATAYQESDLYNIDYGDRDSLGLFQQRPSQGWGTPEQVQDPIYAANAFYDALVEVPDYRGLPVTEAAQRVQRSAFPDAYADHEADARILASALTGNSPATFHCRFPTDADLTVQQPGASGLTPRAERVLDEVTAAFEELPTGGYDPAGVSTGHIEGSAHYDGRAIDIFFRPAEDPASTQAGWSTAHWLVANARRLEIATVIYDDRIWSARRSQQGWREYTPPSGDPDNPVLRHLDHVHVDVARGG